jgi:hypothetical protein
VNLRFKGLGVDLRLVTKIQIPLPVVWTESTILVKIVNGQVLTAEKFNYSFQSHGLYAHGAAIY